MESLLFSKLAAKILIFYKNSAILVLLWKKNTLVNFEYQCKQEKKNNDVHGFTNSHYFCGSNRML